MSLNGNGNIVCGDNLEALVSTIFNAANDEEEVVLDDTQLPEDWVEVLQQTYFGVAAPKTLLLLSAT